MRLPAPATLPHLARRAVPAAGQHRPKPRALSRHRAIHARSASGPRRAAFGTIPPTLNAHPRGQAPPARGHRCRAQPHVAEVPTVAEPGYQAANPRSGLRSSRRRPCRPPLSPGSTARSCAVLDDPDVRRCARQERHRSGSQLTRRRWARVSAPMLRSGATSSPAPASARSDASIRLRRRRRGSPQPTSWSRRRGRRGRPFR